MYDFAAIKAGRTWNHLLELTVNRKQPFYYEAARTDLFLQLTSPQRAHTSAAASCCFPLVTVH